MSICLNCGFDERAHQEVACVDELDCPGFRDEPSDHEMANRYGVEGGIAYEPEEALNEHDWRL